MKNEAGFIVLFIAFIISVAIAAGFIAIGMYIFEYRKAQHLEKELLNCQTNMTLLQRQQQHTESLGVCEDRQGLLNDEIWWQ